MRGITSNGFLCLSLALAASVLASCQSTPQDPAYTAAMRSLYSRGVPKEQLGAVAVVDFTKPSTRERMMIYDHRTGESSTHLVAHGYGSGMKYAENFSNTSGSGQSSLGLYRVGASYYGKHGKALKLHGLENGVNSRAYSRAIVLHSADYVSNSAKWDNFWAGEGWRIGRSAGCPAVSEDDIQEVLSRLPTGSYLYIYAGQQVPLPEEDRLRAVQDVATGSLALGGQSDSDGAVPMEARSEEGGRQRIRLSTR